MARASAIEAAHRNCVSASMAPTIAGVNPFDSAVGLYYRIVGEAPPAPETWEMTLGRWMEPVIIRAFTHHTKLRVKRPRRVFDPAFWFTTEEYGFPMGALLDGITVDSSGNAVVEAKHASTFAGPDWENDIPLHYYFQVQHQLACTGWSRAYACALIGKKFVWLPVERDDEVIALLTDKERVFWNEHVVPRIPPTMDGHPTTTEIVRRRYAHSEPEFAIDLSGDPEVERLCQSYRAYTEAIAKMKLERDAVTNNLLAILDTAESAVTAHYKVTAKEQRRETLDLERLRAEQPAIAAKYTKTTSSRPVRVTKLQDAER